MVHPVAVEAAPTPPRLVGLIRRPVRLAGRRLWRLSRSALLSTALGAVCSCPCLTVCATTAGALQGGAGALFVVLCCVRQTGRKLLSRGCWLLNAKLPLKGIQNGSIACECSLLGVRGAGQLSEEGRKRDDSHRHREIISRKKGGCSKLLRLQSKQIKRAKVGKSGLTALPLVRLAKGGSTRSV